MKSLYDECSIRQMLSAEQSSGFGMNRIQAIRSFARSSGFSRIGIAHCITFGREAAAVNSYLSQDFELFQVDCKYGRLKADELFQNGSSRILCNPAGQADYLNGCGCELNISMGLCVGHDMIFNKKSEAPVTSLFTKDFSNGHNPSAAVDEISSI